jgi:DNA-binding HxlR family transcriptional regulator
VSGEDVLDFDLATLPGRPCSMAAALTLVGEKWALLAVREIFWGNHRFDEIARNTGAPRDRLAARLRGLESVGVVERKLYSQRPARYEYHLTPAGRDLSDVMNALRGWGDRWLATEAPAVVAHNCGEDLDVMYVCRHCGEEVRNRDLRMQMLAPGWDRSGPVVANASEPERIESGPVAAG